MRKLDLEALAFSLFFVPVLTVCVVAADQQEVSAQSGHSLAGTYLGPNVLAASRDGKTLYAACADARQVILIDLPEGCVRQHIGVPAPPTGLVLTPDGSKLMVTCAAPRSTILVLDAISGARVRTIRAGHTAVSPVISSDGKRLYVCDRFDNDVSVIDLESGNQFARVPVIREPVAAALTPDNRWLLVANHLPRMRTNIELTGEVEAVVTAIDTTILKSSQIPLPSGSHSLRSLCVTPDGHDALVTHLLSNFQESPFRVDMGWIHTNVVSVIDIARQEVSATIGMDENDLGAANPWDVTLASNGRTVCVSSAGTHELRVIGCEELLGDFAFRTMQPMMGVWPIYLSLGATLWRRVPLPGKGPRGLVSVGSTVYVAEYFSDSIAAVDLHAQDDTSVRSIPLGPSPAWTLQRQGEFLFHDATICYQQWQSCSSCHPDGREDALNWDLMNDGAGNPKNTKSLLLAHRTPPSMAEAVRASAEVAVRAGLAHILFTERPESEAVAIDAYLKSLEPVPSPHLVGSRLSCMAERGRSLFFSRRVGCHRCHPPPLYTDLKQHNVGTRSPKERNEVFDTPTLIEAWRTAPYLHDGRYLTIRELLDQGHHGLHKRSNHPLTHQELNDLIEFVLSL